MHETLIMQTRQNNFFHCTKVHNRFAKSCKLPDNDWSAKTQKDPNTLHSAEHTSHKEISRVTLVFPHPEATDKISVQVELRRRTSQQHCKAQLQSQLVPHVLQSFSGQHCQLQRGDTDQQHVAVALGALSAWSVYQVLHHGQGLWSYVVSQGRGRGESHHGLSVLLNQQVAADHHAV